MFPSFESHYSRSHTEKKYLNPDLSITNMYRLYINHCHDIETIAQGEPTYRKNFIEEYNLSFKKPNNDTCNECDKYKKSMKTAIDKEIREETKTNNHLEMAEAAYKEKQKDK